MAPGLGVLSAHQRRRARHRHLSRRLRHAERAAAGRARHAQGAGVRSPRQRLLRRRHESRDRWVGLFQGGAADGQGRVDDHPPRAAGPRVGAQYLRAAAPAAPARICRRRRLAADGRRQFRGVQRQGGPRPSRLSSRDCARRRCACRCRRRRSRGRSTRTSAPWRSASLPRRPRSTCGDRRPAGPVRPTATARCRRDVLRQCRPGGFPVR